MSCIASRFTPASLTGPLNILRTFSTSKCLCRNKLLSRGKPLYIHKWREEHDIPAQGTNYGPLTDLPDWRYPDGTPAPLNRGQRNRLLQSEMFAERIIHLTKEVDSAIATHAEMERQRVAEREAIIQSKLREKNERLKSMFSPLRRDRLQQGENRERVTREEDVSQRTGR